MNFEDAVADAAEYLARFKSDLTPEAGEGVQRALYKTQTEYSCRLLDDSDNVRMEWTGHGIAPLVDRSRFDPLADAVVRDIAFDLVDRNEPAPAELTSFLLNPPKRKRGRKNGARAADLMRNFRIAATVFRAKQTGLAAKRNSTAKIRNDGKPTACLVVHEALSRIGAPMSESNVERIWDKYSHLDSSE